MRPARWCSRGCRVPRAEGRSGLPPAERAPPILQRFPVLGLRDLPQLVRVDQVLQAHLPDPRADEVALDPGATGGDDEGGVERPEFAGGILRRLEQVLGGRPALALHEAVGLYPPYF